MPNLYSQEAMPARVLEILRRLTRQALVAAAAAGGAEALPAMGGWEALSSVAVDASAGAEASSSERREADN